MADLSHCACFTGHRPMADMRFCPGDRLYKPLKEALEQEVLRLTWMEGVRVFYIGMAMGFDIFAGEILLHMKNTGSIPEDVRIIAILPFTQQTARWHSADWVQRFLHLLRACTDKGAFSVHHKDNSYKVRNRYMVEHSQYVIAFYNGRRRSGTGMTVHYAQTLQRQVYNLYHDIV